MRVVFVQTYPIYHDLLDTEQWLARENRDRWMPGVLAGMGHDVELWAGAEAAGAYPAQPEGLGAYLIRLFESRGERRTKFHTSPTLTARARYDNADLFILKGVDGGIGTHLLEEVLLPRHRPFVFVIGGKYYTRYVPRARAVFYETEEQRATLARPGARFWRKPVAPEALIRLPKSIDTALFRPLPEPEKRWDVLAVGRLVARLKNYDALARLAGEMRVGVVGDGPEAAALRTRYPAIDWVGGVPNRDLPALLNQARVFFHPSRREYYPRVLAEAMACGLPCAAFADAIAADVLPPACGVRVTDGNYVQQLQELVRDAEARARMGRAARAHAEATLGKASTRPALEQMLARLTRAHATPATQPTI